MNNLEEDECPVSATIPTDKVFQCREGHILCESCLRKIQGNAAASNSQPKCPSCAAPIDDGAVCRNRALENILDRLQIDCPHARNGCHVKIKRNEIKDHQSSCLFGKELEVCSLFGNEGCNFKLRVDTANTIWEHVKSSHPFTKIVEDTVLWSWVLDEAQNVANETGRPLQMISVLRAYCDDKCVAVIGEVSKHSISIYAVDMSLNLSNDSNEDNIRVTVNIPNETAPVLTWNLTMVYGIESWKFLIDKNFPKQIEIGIPAMLKHCDEKGELQMYFRIQKCDPDKKAE